LLAGVEGVCDLAFCLCVACGALLVTTRKRRIMRARRLPIQEINKIDYFVDDRLRQYRMVDIPHLGVGWILPFEEVDDNPEKYVFGKYQEEIPLQ